MIEEKDVKVQINKFHKLVEDLESEKIILLEQFVAAQKKQLSLDDLVKHIITEDTNRKQSISAKEKETTTKVNLVEDNKSRNKDNMYGKELDYKLRVNNQNFKKKGNCFVCGKPGHHAAQCRNKVGKNDNPAKLRVNLAEVDDIIVTVISQIVVNVSDWMIDSGSTRHICANKIDFVSYTLVNEGEEVVYLGDSTITQVLGNEKVLLKLTSEKMLPLTEVLNVPSIRTNLVSV
ncbi:uncharacterized protein [Solanum tuberosum]|uniref:uncharacterized protein n=1 Tax=Solanum tuberosum TaxID=4113 RepID=UPI00073A1491|nr:PREDICTED: uncharacterized protein LOC107063421 [Solanum tuberosum]